ncbi:hypothetical protein D3C73_819450 [compost metagenome]
MEGAVEGDDSGSPSRAAHDLQGVLRSFCAAVGEHAADRVTDRNEAGQALHEVEVRRVGRGIERVVRQPCGLLTNGLDDARVAMAEVQYADAADKVDIAFAIGRPDLGIFAMAEGDGMNDVDRLADGFAAHG